MYGEAVVTRREAAGRHWLRPKAALGLVKTRPTLLCRFVDCHQPLPYGRGQCGTVPPIIIPAQNRKSHIIETATMVDAAPQSSSSFNNQSSNVRSGYRNNNLPGNRNNNIGFRPASTLPQEFFPAAAGIFSPPSNRRVAERACAKFRPSSRVGSLWSNWPFQFAWDGSAESTSGPAGLVGQTVRRPCRASFLGAVESG